MKGQPLPSQEEMQRTLAADADTGQTKNIIRELLDLGTRSFQLGGNGEMFLHKNVMEFITIVKKSGCHCLANTNGTLISREMADELIKLQFDELRITTMAGTPEDYKRTHPGSASDTFYKLEHVLQYLAE